MSTVTIKREEKGLQYAADVTGDWNLQDWKMMDWKMTDRKGADEVNNK